MSFKYKKSLFILAENLRVHGFKKESMAIKSILLKISSPIPPPPLAPPLKFIYGFAGDASYTELTLDEVIKKIMNTPSGASEDSHFIFNRENGSWEPAKKNPLVKNELLKKKLEIRKSKSKDEMDILRGVVSNNQFDWLLEGKFLRSVIYLNRSWFDKFLQYNSDKILKLTSGLSPKYLGSGVTGDVWSLGRDRVLKIFDANGMTPGVKDSRNPYSDTMQVLDYLYTGKADPSLPMIYDSGFFNYGLDSEEELDPEFEAETPNPKWSSTGKIKLAYLVMEKTKTVGEITKEYTKQMSNVKPDDSNPSNNSYVISKEKSIEDFSMKLYETLNPVIQRYNISEDTSDEDFDKYASQLADILKNGWGQETLDFYKNFLNLPDDWTKKFSMAMLRNRRLGRNDLHPGNWGLRGGQIVFFDG